MPQEDYEQSNCFRMEAQAYFAGHSSFARHRSRVGDAHASHREAQRIIHFETQRNEHRPAKQKNARHRGRSRPEAGPLFQERRGAISTDN